MEENLRIYEKLREVPKDAQKPITGGRLKGFTDINGMWRIKALTETFGPCGDGWYIDVLDRWAEAYQNEVAVFVKIALYYKLPNGLYSQPVIGIGGNKVVRKENGGAYVSDEAYKMAETDAIGSACKKIGMGADIYWAEDRTKYNETKPSEPENINQTKARALKAKCKDAGVSLDRLCQLYTVTKVEELTEVQFSNINQFWDKVVESCKA